MLTAFTEVFRNLRTNFFQTFLSVLGIIIGVGALVIMLSLIDGMEAFIKEKIGERNRLSMMGVSSNEGTTLNGVRVSRDTVARLDPLVLSDLLTDLPYPAQGELSHSFQSLSSAAGGATYGIRFQATTLPGLNTIPDSLRMHGAFPTLADGEAGAKIAYINSNLASKLADDQRPLNAVGEYLYLYKDSLRVTGVYAATEDETESLTAFLPLTSLQELSGAPEFYPDLTLDFAEATDVLASQEFVDKWMVERFADIENPTESICYRDYLEEIEQSFLLFRIVMGLIIFIAVIVGGVGVMNVLLMSVAERTPEIGIRKAVGATRRDIITQFLSESLAISVIGCFIGMVLGMLTALGLAPLINYFSKDLKFQAIFTVDTLLVIVVTAILIGVVFGTYPARKAARLDPVVAIRR